MWICFRSSKQVLFLEGWGCLFLTETCKKEKRFFPAGPPCMQRPPEKHICHRGWCYFHFDIKLKHISLPEQIWKKNISIFSLLASFHASDLLVLLILIMAPLMWRRLGFKWKTKKLLKKSALKGQKGVFLQDFSPWKTLSPEAVLKTLQLLSKRTPGAAFYFCFIFAGVYVCMSLATKMTFNSSNFCFFLKGSLTSTVA